MSIDNENELRRKESQNQKRYIHNFMYMLSYICYRSYDDDNDGDHNLDILTVTS